MTEPILIAAPENLHDQDQVRAHLAHLTTPGREAILIWTPEAETSAARNALLEEAGRHAERGELAILLSSDMTVPPSLLSAQVIPRDTFFGMPSEIRTMVPAAASGAETVPEEEKDDEAGQSQCALPDREAIERNEIGKEHIRANGMPVEMLPKRVENPTDTTLLSGKPDIPEMPDLIQAENGVSDTRPGTEADTETLRALAEHRLGDLVADNPPVPEAASLPDLAEPALSAQDTMGQPAPAEDLAHIAEARAAKPTPAGDMRSGWPDLAARTAEPAPASVSRPSDMSLPPPLTEPVGALKAKPGPAAAGQGKPANRGWEPLRIGIALLAIIGGGTLLFNAMQSGGPRGTTESAASNALAPADALTADTPEAVAPAVSNAATLPAGALDVIPEAEADTSATASVEPAIVPVPRDPERVSGPAILAPAPLPGESAFQPQNTGPQTKAARISPDGVVLADNTIPREASARGASQQLASTPALAGDSRALDAAIAEAEDKLAQIEQYFSPPPEILDAETQTLLARRWELRQRIGDLREQRRRWGGTVPG